MHYGAGASGSYNQSQHSFDADSLRSGAGGGGGHNKQGDLSIDLLSNSDKSSSTNNDRRVSQVVLNHISQNQDRDYLECKKMEKIVAKLKEGMGFH
jgi:septum formation inhibitor-activating ATPase MinD